MEFLDYVLARKSVGSAGGSSGGGSSSTVNWIGDGNTHIWITLNEGRTSPVLGISVNGTVTVDWGDGTASDTLTGTSVTDAVYTPNHYYAKPGNYMITLIADGELGFHCPSDPNMGASILRISSSASKKDIAYQNSVRKIEMSNAVTYLSTYAFYNCNSLMAAKLSDSLTVIADKAFYNCQALTTVNIPDGVTHIGTSAFYNCSFTSIKIPDGVTTIGDSAFNSCSDLVSIEIPDGVTSMGINMFYTCYALNSVKLPVGLTSLSDKMFYSNNALAHIELPEGITKIGNSMFYRCHSITSVVIPAGVTNIAANAFASCYGMCYYDFSKLIAVPALGSTNAFSEIQSGCEIRVPMALMDEWKAASGWSSYASYIVGV